MPLLLQFDLLTVVDLLKSVKLGGLLGQERVQGHHFVRDVLLRKHVVLHSVLENLHHLFALLAKPLAIAVSGEVMGCYRVQILENVLLSNMTGI